MYGSHGQQQFAISITIAEGMMIEEIDLVMEHSWCRRTEYITQQWQVQ